MLHGTSAPVEISRQLGLEAETVALEEAIGAGLIGPPEYATQVHALWKDLTEAHVTTAFSSAPWLEGIQDVWAEIRGSGDYCAVVSLSPSFFVERLTGWGAHATYGSRFPAVPFTEPVDPAGILSAAAKVTDRGPALRGVRRGQEPTVWHTATRCRTGICSGWFRYPSPSTRTGIWRASPPTPMRGGICGMPMNW